MDDLIRREAVLGKLDELSELFRRRGETEGKGFLAVQCGVTFAIDEVKRAPSVDAVEAVHAKWENSSHHQFPVCGYCGRFSNTFTNYCPCCGACMDAQTDRRPETGEGEKDG